MNLGDKIDIRLKLLYEGEAAAKQLNRSLDLTAKKLHNLNIRNENAAKHHKALGAAMQRVTAHGKAASDAYQRVAKRSQQVADSATKAAAATKRVSDSFAKMRGDAGKRIAGAMLKSSLVVAQLRNNVTKLGTKLKELAGTANTSLQKGFVAASNRARDAMNNVENGVKRLRSRIQKLPSDAVRVGNAFRTMGKSAFKAVTIGAKTATARMSRFSSAMKQATAAMRKGESASRGFVKQLGRLGLAAVGIFSVGYAVRRLARGLVNMIKVGAQFQNTMAEVAAILGDIGAIGTQTFSRLEAAALRLGRTTVFTARQVAKAQLNMARAGLTATQILGSLDDTINLAAVGNLQMAEAADIAVAAIRALNQSTAEFTNTVNVMTFAAVNSNQTVGDFGQAMRFAAPAAAVASVSIEDLAFSFSLMANAGIKGQKAGAAVRKTFATLFAELNKVGQFEGKLAGLGKELFEIDAASGETKFIGLANALEIMQEKGFTATKAFDVFGVRAGNFFALLAKQGPESIRKFHEELKLAGDIANEIRIKKINTLIGDVILLNSAWEGFSQVVSSEASPALRALTQGLTNVINLTTETVNANDDAAESFSLTIRTIQTISRVVILFSGIFANAFNNISLITERLALTFYSFATKGIVSFTLLVSAAGKAASDVARFFKMDGLADSIDAQVLAGVATLGVLGAQAAKGAKEQADIIEKENDKLAELMGWLIGAGVEVDALSDNHKNLTKEGKKTSEELGNLNDNLEAIKKGWVDYKTKMEAVGITQDQFARGVNAMESSLKKFGATILPTVVRAIDEYDNMIAVARQMGKQDIVKASSVEMLTKLRDGLEAAGVAGKDMRDVLDRLAEAESVALEVRLDTSNLETIKEQAKKTFKGLGIDFMDTDAAEKQIKEIGAAWQHQQDLIEKGVVIPPLEMQLLKNSLREVVKEIKKNLGPEEFEKLKITIPLTAEITDVDVPPDIFALFNAKMVELGSDIKIEPEVTLSSVAKDIEAIAAKLGELDRLKLKLPVAEFEKLRKVAFKEINAIWKFLNDQQKQFFIDIIPNFQSRVFENEMDSFRAGMAKMHTDVGEMQLASLDQQLRDFTGNLSQKVATQEEYNDLKLELFDANANAEIERETEHFDARIFMAAMFALERELIDKTLSANIIRMKKLEAATISASYASSAAGLITAANDIFFNNKSLAIAAGIANTFAAVTMALQSVPYPANIVAAASTAAVGLAAVIKIRRANPVKQIYGGIATGVDNGVDSTFAVRRPGEATLPKPMTDLLLDAGRAYTHHSNQNNGENSPDAARKGGSGLTDISPVIIENLNVSALDTANFQEYMEDNIDALGASLSLAARRGLG